MDAEKRASRSVESRRPCSVSAYSVRGNPSGTVSAPIAWDELDDVDPQELTIATVPARFARIGDPHAAIDDAPFSLQPLLEWDTPAP